MFGFSGRNKARTYAHPVEEFYRPQGHTEIQDALTTARKWGRRGVRFTEEKLQHRARSYAGYLAGARKYLDSEIERLNKKINDPMRYLSYALIIILGIAVTTMALYVDYTILHEIWSRNFANEFFEVPESLRSSVTFKSLQVVFAVLALHYFISHIGKLGRGIYIGVLAAMVLTMLVGIGFLNASSSLPIGSTFFGVELTGETLSAQDELAALGLETDVPADEAATQEVAPPPFGLTEQGYETAKTVLFFASFGLIFFFVSSVGALSLHYAITAFVSFTGGTRGEKAQSEYKRAFRDHDHSDLYAKLSRARDVRKRISDAEQDVRSFIPLVMSAYIDALPRGALRFNPGEQYKRETEAHEVVEKFLEGDGPAAVVKQVGADKDNLPQFTPANDPGQKPSLWKRLIGQKAA